MYLDRKMSHLQLVTSVVVVRKLLTKATVGRKGSFQLMVRGHSPLQWEVMATGE